MIEKATNVLILGIGQSNFLNALYGDILKRDATFNFDIDEIRHLPNDTHNVIETVFSKGLNFGKNVNSLSSIQKRFLLFKAIKKSFYLEIFFFELSQKKSIRKALQVCQNLALKEYIYQKHIKPKKFDVMHFHFCTKTNLEYLHFIGNETKVICSFWGSDLFRVNDIVSNFYVSKALNKANIITVQTPEMALTLKAKYGTHLGDKIKDIRFTISTDIYENINLFRNQASEIQSFKDKYNLSSDKIIVALGHNAFRENNHIQMIKALKILPLEFKKKITFLLHLSYGGKEEYLKELKNVVHKAADLDIKIIEEFMAPAEISKLRLITNVMIQAPVSDALSGAMTEVLYAGNKVISGAWLPYDILRRNQIRLEEFEKFENIPSILMQTITNLQNDFSNVEENKKHIEDFLFPEKTSKEWIELFKTMLDD